MYEVEEEEKEVEAKGGNPLERLTRCYRGVCPFSVIGPANRANECIAHGLPPFAKTISPPDPCPLVVYTSDPPTEMTLATSGSGYRSKLPVELTATAIDHLLLSVQISRNQGYC